MSEKWNDCFTEVTLVDPGITPLASYEIREHIALELRWIPVWPRAGGIIRGKLWSDVERERTRHA